ncbi:hypothetical protein [Limnoglobus roseus]|uniref:Uncharacterized protein n=1 Tax=Limnoglobus roseus TaxID=2598579 RepID=A0A5C1AHG4_9BACT|nr:hypothetical protein [Limnoglobus roseus]QEL17693.1 hypothetical protein PX52LOC_04692 [Limnoglobus roseus]
MPPSKMKRTRAERREQLERLRAARNAEIDRQMMVYFFSKGLDPTRKPGVDVVELILNEEYGPAVASQEGLLADDWQMIF